MAFVRYKRFHGLLLGAADYNGVTYYSYANKHNELVAQLKYQIYSKTGDRVSVIVGDETT